MFVKEMGIFALNAQTMRIKEAHILISIKLPVVIWYKNKS
jgi:hypothetical protein